MSLKAFHIAFITASAILSLGLAAYAVVVGTTEIRFVWSGVSLIFGVALIIYGNRFLKKMKDVSYL